MKKKLIILFLIVITINIFAFNYDNYKPYSLNKLVKYIKKTSNLKLPGLTYYNESISFPLELTYYPDNSNDNNFQNEIKYFAKIFNTSKENFGYVQVTKIKNYQLILVYQNILISPLKKDVKLNEKIGMYCILGYFNDFGKKIVCLVSAFNTKNDYIERNAKPIWEIVK